MDAKTVLTGLASFALNAVGFLTSGQSEPLINPVFGDTLQSLLSGLPYVGGWFAQLPATVILFGASFLLVWILMGAIFSMMPGWIGPILAFGVGIFVVLLVTGNLGAITGLIPSWSSGVP